MTWAVGKYSGTGATQSIILGFQPVFCCVYADAGGTPTVGAPTWMGTSHTQGALGQSSKMTGNLTSAGLGIRSLDATGFTVGANWSQTDPTSIKFYTYMACDNLHAFAGSFTGNGTSQVISGLSFQPEMVLIEANSSSNAAAIQCPIFAGTIPMNGAAEFTNGIVRRPDGFFVGSDSRVNANFLKMHYVAFQFTEGEFEVLGYTGDGSDPRTITIGREVTSAWVKTGADSGAKLASQAFWYGPAQINQGGASIGSDGSVGNNRIESLSSTGLTIGSQSEVNSNSYLYAAFCVTSGVHGKTSTPARSATQGHVT